MEGDTDLLAAFEAASKKAGELQPIEIPELGIVAYSSAISFADSAKIETASDGDSHKAMLKCVMYKLCDKDGKRIFKPGDLDQERMLKKLGRSFVLDLVNKISAATAVDSLFEDAEKKD